MDPSLLQNLTHPSAITMGRYVTAGERFESFRPGYQAVKNQRTMPRFETAHPVYSFLNRLIAVASGDRRPEGPIYTIHEVL